MVEQPAQEPIFEAKLADGDAPTRENSNTTKPNQKILESKTAILALLFGVTGFLGIPLLWKNPKFSQNERILWSLIVTVYTLTLIYIAFAICMWSYRQITGAY